MTLQDIVMAEAPLAQEVFQADPRTLDFTHRLDVLVKMLYAQQRLGQLPGWVHRDVKDLYVRHIHLRTGGREPGEERIKSSIDDYLRHFDALIDDMSSQGFDTRHPVLISSSNQLPRNGAHRLATALALGSDIAWRADPNPGGEWGARWFREHGFANEEINLLLRAWFDLTPERATIGLLWSPAETLWPAIEAQLAKAGYGIMDARTLELPQAAADELVRDVYAFDWGPKVGASIEAKVRLLRGFAPRVRVLFLQAPAESAAEFSRLAKQQARESAKSVVPVEWFATLHLSESANETRHLLDMFASEHSLHRLKTRGPMRPGLVDMLAELHAELQKRRIDPADVCVVGGAVPDALGLREADDVDFTLTQAQRLAHFDRGITKMSANCDVVTMGYPRSFDAGQAAPTDDALIANPGLHFIARGFRFASPQVVLTRKQHQRRPKDLRDLPLLASVIDR